MLTFEQLLRKEEYQKGVDEGRGGGIKEGLKKGIKKGVQQGQRELLLRLLTEAFGSLPAAVTERVSRASLPEVERWGMRIRNAASLDDVFAAS